MKCPCLSCKLCRWLILPLSAFVLFVPRPKADAEDTTYRLKVVVASHSTGHVEAKFTTMPEDLRMVCETDKLDNMPFEGDYVRIDYDDKHGYTIHGTKLQCKGFVWVK